MQTYGTPAFLQPELPILSNSEMPFRSILRAARISRSLTAPHDGHTHVRSRSDRPLLMQPHSQVLEEGYHLSILCIVTPRAKFKEERPQYFIGDDRTVFRCLDSSLKREEKIAACVAHKRVLKEGIITSFINHLKKHSATLYSWFSSEVDSEGKNRLCLSDKAVSYLNKRLVSNGLKVLSASYLFRLFRKMVKNLFGSNIRSFLNSCLMSVSTEEVLTKSIKKIVSKTVLFLYKRVLKAYRRACGLKYDPDLGGLSAIHT